VDPDHDEGDTEVAPEVIFGIDEMQTQSEPVPGQVSFVSRWVSPFMDYLKTGRRHLKGDYGP